MKKAEIKNRYKEILKPYRVEKNNNQNNNPSLAEEFLSDKTRVIFSSSFRMMQQKTQVFPLEPNSSIRSRLTHTIEVADISRIISQQIFIKLLAEDMIDSQQIDAFTMVPEIASMIHDMGNPPFGHFGEESIRSWFEHEWKSLSKYVGLDTDKELDLRIKDFLQFDGNPQSLRIILRLHCERGENGLNLTLPSILSSIKYTRCTDEEKLDSFNKSKAGYFQTEKKIINSLYKEINWDKNARFPLAYIMDVADDLAYSFSDISDGIEKKILTLKDFKEIFIQEWKKEYGSQEKINMKIPDNLTNFVTDITTSWISQIIPDFANGFVLKQKEIFNNSLRNLEELYPDKYRFVKIIKKIGRNKLYRSEEVETLEIAGFTMVNSVINHYSSLLKIDKEDFLTIMKGGSKTKKDTKIEGRYLNRLSKIYKDNYLYQIESLKKNGKYNDLEEWILRMHLILDNLSGMTDESLKRQHRLFEGIDF